MLGPIIIILLIWLTNVIAPLGATPFLFVGFLIYGETVVIYALIAAIFASVSNYWIARMWGRSIVTRIVGIDNLKKIDHLTENHGLSTLFIFRTFLGNLHDIISYVFGLTKIRFTPYLLVSTSGMIPGTILWYYMSSKIHDPIVFTITTWGLAYLFLGFYFSWIKITKRLRKFSG